MGLTSSLALASRKYTLIDALSSNNAAYLRTIANNTEWIYNSDFGEDEFSQATLYLYPDITIFNINLSIKNIHGVFLQSIDGKMQICGGNSYTIKYKALADTSWTVFENSDVTPVKISNECVFSETANWDLLDKTPNPFPLEINFPAKGSYAISIRKFETNYTPSTAVSDFGSEIYDWMMSLFTTSPDGGDREYWRAAQKTQIIPSFLIFNSFSQGGIVGIKTKNAYASVRVYSRNGTSEQRRLPGFSNLSRYVNMPSGSKITFSGDQAHTTTKPTDGVRIRIQAPAMFSASDEGDLEETSVSFNIYYRKVGTSTWIPATSSNGTTFTMTGKTNSVIDAYFSIWFASKQFYDIKVDRITADSTDSKLMNDTYLASVVEIEHTDIAYINRAIFGLVLRATDKLSGEAPTVTVIVKGKLVRSVKDIYDFGGGVPEKFSRNPADFIVDAMTNKYYGGGRYYSLKNIDIKSALEFWEWCEEEVPVYIEKSSISDYGSDNIYVYGMYFTSGGNYYKCIKSYEDGVLGMLPTNTEYFSVMSVSGEFIVDMQKRFEINFVVDQKYRLSDFITKICETCRTKPYWRGDKLHFFIDKPGTPTMMFSMGNIISGSFQETYISLTDIPNQIEATYKDESLEYAERSVICVDFSRQTTEDVKSNEVQLYGLTNKHRIKRELYYYMRKAKAITKSIVFETNASAMYADIGSLIWFQFYTPYYGDGGHVVAVSGATIKFSSPVSQTYMNSYGLRVQRKVVSDPVTIEKVFFNHSWTSGITGEIWEITLPSADHGITVGDVYQAGLVGKEAKPFRVTSISEKDYTVVVTAEEYNEDVYDEWELDPTILQYSGFGNRPLADNYVPNITSIKLAEQISLSGSTSVSNIFVSFQQPVIYNKTAEFVEKCEVYFKEKSSAVWMKAGETKETSFVIPSVKVGATYYVCVLAVTNQGNSGFLSKDWFIQDAYSIKIYGQVDAIYENGVYVSGTFVSPQEQMAIGSILHTTKWLMEPNTVSFTFTDDPVGG